MLTFEGKYLEKHQQDYHAIVFGEGCRLTQTDKGVLMNNSLKLIRTIKNSVDKLTRRNSLSKYNETTYELRESDLAYNSDTTNQASRDSLSCELKNERVDKPKCTCPKTINDNQACFQLGFDKRKDMSKIEFDSILSEGYGASKSGTEYTLTLTLSPQLIR